MARMPDATWMPIPGNHTVHGMGVIHGVTLHIMAGTLSGTDTWFRNPRARASSHFGTGRAGQLRQWVDSKDRAWAQVDGNPNWLSIENEGRGGDELTNAQLDACAKVLAWAHLVHGVPLQSTGDPGGRGLGHHAMGGAAWGGHTACPGPRIVSQKKDILARARRLVADGPDDDGGGPPPWSGRLLMYVKGRPVMSGQDVRVWQAALNRRVKAARLTVDGVFGPGTAAATRTFQRREGMSIDGIVGPNTWRAGFDT